MSLLKGKKQQRIYISSLGMKNMIEKQRDNKYPCKNIAWTDDFRCELPIKLTPQGVGSLQPQTLIDVFHRCIKNHAKKPALSVKRNNKWQTLNFEQFYFQSQIFGRALIALSAQQFTSINIIGFNSPQWSISFFGSIFARCLPSGIYTTNSAASCEYVARNSDCKIIVAENYQYAKKYQNMLDNGQINFIIIYNDPKYQIPSKYQRKIFKWKEFLHQGHRVQPKFLHERMEKVKPGNCCTLVYTSGTTGMPKGVMLSHDNFTWTKKSMDAFYQRPKQNQQIRMVSFLPLSHVAAQFSDIVTPLAQGNHVYFADPSALQGSLVETLKQVRPHVFFSVPRVWQKIYDKMQQIAKNNGAIKTYLATWAKNIGSQGTVLEYQKKDTQFCYKLAKVLVYDNIKKALGLDKCRFFLYGAAPMDPKIRSYFLSLGIFLVNSYGMSQSTGPQNFSNPQKFDWKDMNTFKQVGKNLPGTQQKIVKSSQSQTQGQICYRGRNIFMGYYKNPEQTNKVIDEQGFLHSGDMGRFNQDGVLYITGRVKQLIITAGGQNIPPLIIQHQIISHLPFVSQVMVVGEQKKFLTCLISIKQTNPGSGKIQSNAKHYLSLKGAEISTIEQARKSKIVNNLINQGIKKANQKAISRAQNVQDYHIIPQEFSVQNGLLTPTMKLKRKQASKKYHAQIQQMYFKSKL